MAERIYTYRYTPYNITITLDQNYTIDDGSISYLYIIHDYEQRRLPIIKMHIDLEAETIEKMYKYKDTNGRIKFSVKEEQIDSDEKIINTRIYLDYVFSYIPAKDQNEYLTSKDIETESVADEMSKYQSFECYLIDMDAVNWFTKQISVNFHNASKPAILHALLEMRDIPYGKVIATPPQDYSTVTNAVFPYGDLIGNIMLLNHKYGIYSFTPTVYYDLHYLYCINRLNPNIVLNQHMDFGETLLLLYNSTNVLREAEGSYDDLQANTHVINIKQDPVITDAQQKKTSSKFSTVTTIDKRGRVSKQTAEISKNKVSKVSSSRDTSSAMAYAYAYNNLTQDQLMNDNLAKGRTIDIIVNNINLGTLRPYKRYSFQVDTQFVNMDLNNKTFRLRGWGVLITRDGGRSTKAHYIHTVSISLFEQTIS